jgi:hypothetical protein
MKILPTYNIFTRAGYINQRGQTFHEANPAAAWDEATGDFAGPHVFAPGQWTDREAATDVASRIGGTVVAAGTTEAYALPDPW